MPAMDDWIPMKRAPEGVGGQVWVAYPNPQHPLGWNLRVQWTPIIPELNVEPYFWKPIAQPPPPPKTK